MARGLRPPHPGFKHLTFRPRGRHPCYVPPPIMVQQRRLRSTLRSDPKCLCKIRCRPCRLLSAVGLAPPCASLGSIARELWHGSTPALLYCLGQPAFVDWCK